MMRLFFILFICLVAAFLFLQEKLNERISELPVFLRNDSIVAQHTTKINLHVQSVYRPDTALQLQLKNDYSSLWAHLNYLYSTNNTEAGKEYYTEEWFRQINRNYEGVVKTMVQRADEEHNLYIKNWAEDGLVCTVIDSNAVFTYKYANGVTKNSLANMAVSLLYQGDHWRIEAIRVLNENFLTQ